MYESYAQDRLNELFTVVGIDRDDSDLRSELALEIAALVVDAMMDSELYESFESLAADQAASQEMSLEDEDSDQ